MPGSACLVYPTTWLVTSTDPKDHVMPRPQSWCSRSAMTRTEEDSLALVR